MLNGPGETNTLSDDTAKSKQSINIFVVVCSFLCVDIVVVIGVLFFSLFSFGGRKKKQPNTIDSETEENPR